MGQQFMNRSEGPDKVAVLAGHFLLRDLPRDDLDKLTSYAKAVRYPAHRVVFHKGDPGDGMMAVISGRIKIRCYSLDGKELVLNVIKPGELFGEIALLDAKPRTADAVTMEPCELLVLERRDFLPFLADRPQACFHLLTVLCERLRQTSQQLEDSLFLDLAPRLARCLVRLAERFGNPVDDGVQIDVRLSQQELAAFVGMTRESVNKQLATWRREGVVGFSAGTVTIYDMAELRFLSGIDDEPGGAADGL
jgi:CRP/FNR family cyclic AMP-dependent transcriptional regulator